ncbi:MAG: Glutamine amidotransferase, cobB/cobQ-like protein [candidate division CPR2 bacterium GW2011_GWC1_39_9]|uniref:Lipid II isoglutaminyl synthase (glutamine-hydrolyzing) subunit GatD n=1 Tax=candidate division CPR2 bacterium GW2011_GWC2_39_10 TaxID=1618345 RepID=A0A0G0PXQ8_UNCC2|nr:MAG: Glutamine amidotransferase, cobB/cobQ-like protein [candidate division CPR2 bacterium GW2011_GWC2_39_10]KKR35045.1 MAG: Glutamine amidotransferase, cobB/cobQ-like protein [candidate division CPR2 bacterium GW2011_GWC1_39_9]
MRKIKICHLYPDAMNLYGDVGNIIAIKKRCEWRGFECEIIDVKVGDRVNFNDVDIIFMGGGQDRGQMTVAKDLVKKGKQIREAVESDMAVLTICGGYQLFGKYFKTTEGEEIPGIGIFDAFTEASNQRMIGNVLVDCRRTTSHWSNMHKFSLLEKMHASLVGFENHSGKTILGPAAYPLGHVIKGYGNDGKGTLEGCQYRNAFGTYLHGSLLPKNPWFADHLIILGLRHRYGSDFELPELNDDIEIMAHNAARDRVYTARVDHI